MAAASFAANHQTPANLTKFSEQVVRPGGLELPTFWFVARRSIQLSYGRTVYKYYHRLALVSSLTSRTNRPADDEVLLFLGQPTSLPRPSMNASDEDSECGNRKMRKGRFIRV